MMPGAFACAQRQDDTRDLDRAKLRLTRVPSGKARRAAQLGVVVGL